MVALPGFNAFILPFLTLTILLLLDDHLTFWLVAFFGLIVSVNTLELPIFNRYKQRK